MAVQFREEDSGRIVSSKRGTGVSTTICGIVQKLASYGPLGRREKALCLVNWFIMAARSSHEMAK